jgi:phospholipase B1
MSFFIIGDQFCPGGQYKEATDMFNGAQSGARSLNLDNELDYILQQLDEAYDDNKIQRTDWKLVTFFIGSNDVCHACAVNSSLPEPYSINVQMAVERVRLTIPNVLIQIIGMIRVDEIFVATIPYASYCQPFPRNDFVLHDHECGCGHSAVNRTIMANLVPQYNSALAKIASFYQTPMYANESFAVVYRPLPVDILSFPIQAIR